jgi:hypothetical protein
MSFPHSFVYTVVARPELRACSEIDEDFANFLLSDPIAYRNPEMISNRLIADEVHELSIKLLFLADMRREYAEHFFGGNAPISAEFFDRWWTLVKCDEPQDVTDVLLQLDEREFCKICGALPQEMRHRLEQMKSSPGR